MTRRPHFDTEVGLSADSDHRKGFLPVRVDGETVTLVLDVDLDDGVPGTPVVTDSVVIDDPRALLDLALALTRAAEFALLDAGDATGADCDAEAAGKDLERALLRLLGRW